LLRVHSIVGHAVRPPQVRQSLPCLKPRTVGGQRATRLGIGLGRASIQTAPRAAGALLMSH
jgi:hypothetical protein